MAQATRSRTGQKLNVARAYRRRLDTPLAAGLRNLDGSNILAVFY
jgi:hypothetical protein